jgi:hypothetical protein
MQRCLIDHIIVTAASLEAGAAFVQQALGVEPQTGGRHPRMGTHNLLLRLGDALFLEVIAIDPAAAHPGRPRWFGLDARAADTPPVLSAWVARSADIRAGAAQATEPLGDIEPMTRGALDWLITIPADGCVPLDGVAPALIQWQTGQHPAATLPNLGLALAGLEIFHPQPQRVERLLVSICLDAPVTVAASPDGVAPRLVAQIDTPDGRRRLAV